VLGTIIPIVIFIAIGVAVVSAVAIARKKKAVPAEVAAKWS
jgi:hypothetical protein